MASYPRSLKLFVNRLSNFSTNVLKITPYRTSAVSSGDIITVDLPNSSMLELNSLTMHFLGTTSTDTRFPRNIEGIISKIVVEINGQTLNSCQNLSDLYQIMYNLQQGADLKAKRALYQNSTGGGVLTGNDVAVPYKIHNFLGFLGSVKPETLDTALLGSVRIHITLENGNVLIGNNGATSGSFTLDNLFFTVNAVSIDDGIYYQAKNSYLASGGIFEMPFDNWYSSLFSTGGTYQQSSRFSLSTQSLDFLLATFPRNRTIQSNVTDLHNTGYFQYDGECVNDWQFQVNNVAVPQFRAGRDEAYALTLNALGLSQSVDGGIDDLITSASVWNKNFWVASTRLDCPTDPDERYVSGLNSLGTNCQISFDTTAGYGMSNISNCLMFAKTTSTLRVGAGKNIELVN